MKKTWWKEVVIYQIYPRSFCDSNGDGIGDIKGIIGKLDYLSDLGIDVVWISPCYESPNDDNGYDISDYRSIMKEFGTLQDFTTLLAQAHNRNIKIVMDLVVNHSSDEHPWFVESRKSKENPYRDYYIWRKGNGNKEPNNWGSYFTTSAWEYDEATDEYFLHLFSKKQPDLNWENPKLRDEIYAMMEYWLDMGVDGFRMDVANLYKKPYDLPDSCKPATYSDGHVFDPVLYSNNVGLMDIFQEMNQRVLDKYDAMTVGETVEVTPEIALPYVDENNQALSMVFQFEVVSMRMNFSWRRLKEVQRKWIEGLKNKGWNSQYLQNHDQPRSVSTYGNDKEFWKESAKLLATMIHTLPGTPYVYQGEEIGMTNNTFPSIDAFNDINAKFIYEEMLKSGKSEQECLDYLNKDSRDHSRTPMQWNAHKHAGFTAGEPWIMMNPNYEQINVENQIGDENSIYNYYKKLISLRRNNPVMVYGEFKEFFEDSEEVYVYKRELNETSWLIVLNVTSREIDVDLPLDMSKWSYVISNYDDKSDYTQKKLRPYAAMILEKEQL